MTGLMENLRKTILIVDDDAILAMGTSSFLEAQGYSVRTANSGEKAVEIALNDMSLDLILMDIDLGSEMDGTEAAEKILAHRDIPLLFLSGHTEPEIVERTERITSYGYVVKDSGETVLCTSIKMAFRLYEAQMSLRAHEKQLMESLTRREEIEATLNEKSAELERFFDSVIDLFCIADMDGYFRRLNREWEKVLGYSLQELEGACFLDFVHPADIASTREAMMELSEQRPILSFTNRYRCKDGSYRWIEWRSFPWGKQIYAAARDITSHHEREEALRHSEEKYRRIVEMAHEGIWVIDRSGRTVFVNEQMARMLGYLPGEMAGRHAESFMSAEDQADHRKRVAERAEGRSGLYERRLLRKDGTICWCLVSATSLYNDKGLYDGSISMLTDITDRKRAEEELRARELLYRQMFTGHSAVMWLVNPMTGEIIDANPAAGEFYGYPLNVLKGMNISQISSNDPQDIAAQRLRFLTRSDRDVHATHQLANGELRNVEIHSVPIDVEGSTLLYSIIHDITERRHAEEARMAKEELYRQMFQCHSAFMLLVDPVNGAIVDANPAACAFYQYSIDELKQMNIDQINTLQPEEVEKARQAFLSRDYSRRVFQHRLASGEIRDVETHSVPIDVKGSTLLYSIVSDITERRKAESALETALREKSALLRELPHRVKNSLFIITGLVGLEAQRLSEEPAHTVLLNIRSRIVSISNLYEMLYQADDVMELSLNNYIERLCRSLHTSYARKAGIVEIITELCEVRLEVKRALPLGLILNELVTNALKYAYPGDSGGKVHVRLSCSSAEAVVEVEDDGIGLPRGFDLDSAKGLGMVIVRMLVEQIGSTMEMVLEKSTLFRIRIPLLTPCREQ